MYIKKNNWNVYNWYLFSLVNSKKLVLCCKHDMQYNNVNWCCISIKFVLDYFILYQVWCVISVVIDEIKVTKLSSGRSSKTNRSRHQTNQKTQTNKNNITWLTIKIRFKLEIDHSLVLIVSILLRNCNLNNELCNCTRILQL